MKKTKLTLFVAVLAAALFGVGCSRVPKPDVAKAVKWKGHYYAIFTESLSWDAAKAECEKLGGHLVIIESEIENQFLWDLVSTDKAVKDAIAKNKSNVFVHIGCFQSSDSKQWKWVNGQSITYSNWSKATILQKNTHGGIALSPVSAFPSVKPSDWVNEYGDAFFICEWE